MKEKNSYTIMRTGLANDWLGIPIDPFSEHIEGRYTEVLMRPKLDERTGSMLIMYLQVPGKRIIFPLVKKNVDEIIANSAHTDKFGIKYHCQVRPGR